MTGSGRWPACCARWLSTTTPMVIWRWHRIAGTGQFEPGWMEYEWRNLTEAGKATMPAMTWHLDGMNLPTGRLLLVGDQGYGDAIQFAATFRWPPSAVRS